MKKKIVIEGMSCMNCVKHVKEALEAFGVTAYPPKETVEVNLEGKYAIVETTATDEALIAAIDDAGYDVVAIEII